jgi:perosamine synthetase
MDHLKEEGIQTRPVWHLNHLQVPYRECQAYRIEKALELLDVTLSLPCSVSLTETDIRYVTDRLRHA